MMTKIQLYLEQMCVAPTAEKYMNERNARSYCMHPTAVQTESSHEHVRNSGKI